MAPLKKKGDLAELKVAADLVSRGCELSIPFGEDSSYVDWIAVYDATTNRCYYIPSWILGEDGCGGLRLRLVPARNNQSLRIRRAEDYLDPDFSIDPSMEPAGFEPAAS